MNSFSEKLKRNLGVRQESETVSKKKTEPQKTEEGQLAIDVYQTDQSLVIQSTIAGVKSSDIELLVENDILTIRGKRSQPDQETPKHYFYRECYWGPFSRQIILPEKVDSSRIKALLKDGILTVTIPRIERREKKKIIIEEE